MIDLRLLQEAIRTADLPDQLKQSMMVLAQMGGESEHAALAEVLYQRAEDLQRIHNGSYQLNTTSVAKLQTMVKLKEEKIRLRKQNERLKGKNRSLMDLRSTLTHSV